MSEPAERLAIFMRGLVAGTLNGFKAVRSESCYPDCTGDGVLSVADFGCFQTRFVAGEPPPTAPATAF